MKLRLSTSLAGGALLLAAVVSHSAEGCEADYCIDWYSIDSGGVLHAETVDEHWQLSGTIGQWDANEARDLAGGEWQLTGGFWGLSLEDLANRLFGDRFEAED